MKARALIAEDEPLLAANLEAELLALWPSLEIAARVGDGESAVEQALKTRPDVVFLDIRMPGLDGIDAARTLAEEWPGDGTPFPALVFVTAYERFAVQAFERAAFDYILKPVEPRRLEQTCIRLRASLGRRAEPERADLGVAVERLRTLLAEVAPAGPSPQAPLRLIQAGSGNAVHMVPVDDVLYFEAADKYVRVVTPGHEHLVRLSLRELVPRLDATRFWQVHRGTVVRADAIVSALRDEAGRIVLTLRGTPDRIAVSRLHAHLFKAM